MQIFDMSFDKTTTTSYDPVLGRMVKTTHDPYTSEQYDDLGDRLELALGEGFVSFEVNNFPTTQQLLLKYNGPVVEEVEYNRNDEIDLVINTWYEDNL